MVASERGHVATVKVLLAAGADTDIQDQDSHSALVFAAQYERIDVMKALLEHGVDVNVGEDDWNPLHWAAQFNSAGCITVLLDAGADIDVKCSFLDGRTSLHFAAETGNNEALLALLRRGASVHQTTDDGSTALHLVSEMEGHAPDDTVDILLRRGASEQAVDRNGKAPVDLFKRVQRRYQSMGPMGDSEWPELERAIELLARAPADRTWRRRCWLIMLRERTNKERTIHGGRRRKGKKVGNGEGLLLGDGKRGGGNSVRRSGRSRGRGGARAAVEVDLRGLVSVLVCLESDGVFRTILGYI
ncbi:unnamed protein product [Ectocarpus sp. 6 AP-2014]